ncbi:MAG: hypothetical protein LRY40_06395 [Shewanella fodinae]|nr:hypothetical protein [Shewanella fodinae]
MMKMVVACRNSNGEADLYVCDIDVTDEDVAEGKHYDLAEELAEGDGYQEPFLCFDRYEQQNIVRQLPEIGISL